MKNFFKALYQTRKTRVGVSPQHGVLYQWRYEFNVNLLTNMNYG